MGLESKLAIKKFEGQNNFTWIGEKNLSLYDNKFEKISILVMLLLLVVLIVLNALNLESAAK